MELSSPRSSAIGAGPRYARDPRVRAHLNAVELALGAELDALEQALPSGPDTALPASLDPMGQLRRLQFGGKRVRPVMVLLGWLAADVDRTGSGQSELVPASAALELLHCFALVHDDVMDESRTRRGGLTVHADAARWHTAAGGRGDATRFGDSVAVLVGDLAHAEADRLAARLPAAMQQVWRAMVLELVDGQLHDILGAATSDRASAGLTAARRVARHKTGGYTIARPLQLGAVASGADADALAALDAYGRHVGEAFALTDDLLGVFGDPDETGKPVGDDLRAGKPTVLLAMARAALRGPAAAALGAAGTTRMTDAQVTLVQDAMRRDGVLAGVERMIADRVRDALAALRGAVDAGHLTGDGATLLSELAGELAGRGR